MLSRFQLLDADEAVARWKAGVLARGLTIRKTGVHPNRRNTTKNYNHNSPTSFWNEEEIRGHVAKTNDWLRRRFGGQS